VKKEYFTPSTHTTECFWKGKESFQIFYSPCLTNPLTLFFRPLQLLQFSCQWYGQWKRCLVLRRSVGNFVTLHLKSLILILSSHEWFDLLQPAARHIKGYFAFWKGVKVTKWRKMERVRTSTLKKTNSMSLKICLNFVTKRERKRRKELTSYFTFLICSN
jgi:hypothetical protein